MNLKNPSSLIVVDFYVVCHQIFRDAKPFSHLYSEENLKKIIKALWALRVSRGPDMIDHNPDSRVMVVKDNKYRKLKNYWRQVEIAKDDRMDLVWESFWETNPRKKKTSQEYKGTREDKSDFFNLVSKIGQDYCNTYYNIYLEEGFEADDIAGAIYRTSRDTNSICRDRTIYFMTNDRDWGQLVDDEHRCFWANTRYPKSNEKIQHRLAGNKEVIEHTLHKHGLEINHPRELVNVKTLKGDLGDNLPPGSPTDYMDLCEVPERWMPENLIWWERCLREDLNNPEPNIQTEHYLNAKEQLNKIGALPIGDF